MNWIELSTPTQIQDIQEKSSEMLCLVYKHSTTCSICSMAKMRLERAWDFTDQELKPYFLDILSHRDLSDRIATVFTIEHESPQILLIKDGICVHHADHFDIDLNAVKKILS